ncbi:transposase [Lachnobacterium bovis]|uniref:transposase n=1 Tax=Lachnobacterium bovis TaxID=140626 RepID=UPI0004897093|nr:transposase [Lachnobacterium bovis]
MKYLNPNTLRRNLFDSIDQILLNKASYVKNPTDHSRTRKLSFRILKIKLGEDTCETIITNLPAETFSLSEIKKLYSMRWGIETSFRDLKYPLGLLNFHARKTDLIYQEISATGREYIPAYFACPKIFFPYNHLPYHH